jgi:hypothetical protein
MFWVVLQDFFHIFPAEGCLVPHGKIRHLRELEEQHAGRVISTRMGRSEHIAMQYMAES